MKKTRFALLLALPLTAWLWAGGCYFDNLQELHPELLLDANCDTTVVISYQTHLKPVFSASCGANNSCHNAGGAGGGVVLESYAGVKSAVNSGKLLSSILWDGNSIQMPKASAVQLNACAIAKIQKWIDAGATDN